ncbi:MAG: hypothetical protein EPN91_07565 [Salinibacterium sp.]|nr:MAG: hypothetical protein EPN91_07565 [Salinibacterium sp.]
MILLAGLTRGQACAQAVHAAGESAPFRLPKGTVAVALEADDQAHLLELDARLSAGGISHALITECDGQVMAIGIEPTRDRAKIRKVTSHLRLIK